jgi:hypothetical protein
MQVYFVGNGMHATGERGTRLHITGSDRTPPHIQQVVWVVSHRPLLLLLLLLLLCVRYGNPAFRSWFADMMDRTPQWVGKVRALQHNSKLWAMALHGRLVEMAQLQQLYRNTGCTSVSRCRGSWLNGCNCNDDRTWAACS